MEKKLNRFSKKRCQSLRSDICLSITIISEKRKRYEGGLKEESHCYHLEKVRKRVHLNLNKYNR